VAVILSNLPMDEGRRVYFNEIDKMGRGEEKAGGKWVIERSLVGRNWPHAAKTIQRA
jgi:hypothetical protein